MLLHPNPRIMTASGLKKRSLTIAGHATSIALEPAFWQALEEAAQVEGLSLPKLVGRIDAERLKTGGGLASALRVWLFKRARA